MRMRNVKILTGGGTTAVLFIRHVTAVVVPITDVPGWDTSPVLALELARTARLDCIQSRTVLNLIGHLNYLVLKVAICSAILKCKPMATKFLTTKCEQTLSALSAWAAALQTCYCQLCNTPYHSLA